MCWSARRWRLRKWARRVSPPLLSFLDLTLVLPLVPPLSPLALPLHSSASYAALRPPLMLPQEYHILNCDDHASFLRKHKRDPADYRPDILHQVRH